jgi:hypothetical protein
MKYHNFKVGDKVRLTDKWIEYWKLTSEWFGVNDHSGTITAADDNVVSVVFPHYKSRRKHLSGAAENKSPHSFYFENINDTLMFDEVVESPLYKVMNEV